ncbi:MAG TPA: ATP-dependent sacrificial sulfur transferase LarE [bacterium]|nr:ATP-dependent sacrificial sulfur transferase LarE [bacterium]
MALAKLDGVAGPLAAKAADLVAALRALSPVLVAFSGGVDSSLLLAAAQEACGGRALAVTASSPTFPRRELDSARAIAALVGARLKLIKTHEVDDPAFSANPQDRCYHCKRELFAKLAALASAEGYRAVVEGSNVDDLGDFRPGEQAARELGVVSPLRQVGLSKADVRELARAIGLPNWDKPAAACLASRFPYGTEITRDGLAKIERLEDALHDLGFHQVRARAHGDLLRVELEPREIETASAGPMRERIVQAARREGFRFVALDLAGYRTGSFNP